MEILWDHQAEKLADRCDEEENFYYCGRCGSLLRDDDECDCLALEEKDVREIRGY